MSLTRARSRLLQILSYPRNIVHHVGVKGDKISAMSPNESRNNAAAGQCGPRRGVHTALHSAMVYYVAPVASWQLQARTSYQPR